MLNLQDIVTYSAIAAGIVALFQLLEYIFTKNLPWVARLLRRVARWIRRHFGRKVASPDQRFLVVNFSSHPLLPGQKKAIQTMMNWPSLEVIDSGLNVPEGVNFAAKVTSQVEKIDLLPKEWQTCHLVVVPAGYSPAWSVVLAELHGRLGYFPNMVRLRPVRVKGEEPFEVAEIVTLREIRSKGRSKR